MKLEEIIAAVQQALGVQVDGKPGTETWSAIYQRVLGKSPNKPALPPVISPVDPRSEGVIATLLPEVRPLARALVHKAGSMGIRIKIISGYRTYEEQAAIYAQGRTKPGPKVTNSPPGYSNHNFGIAFDVGVFEGNSYRGESPKYAVVGGLGTDLGLEWGGSWTSFVDQPHYQLRPEWAADMTSKQMMAELRARHDDNAPVFA